MNKEDFHEWKIHPVTERVFAQIREEIAQLQSHLGKSAGKDPSQDRWFCGVIHGLDSLLNIEVEEEN